MKKICRKCVQCSFSVYLLLAIYCFLAGILLTFLDSSTWCRTVFSPLFPILFDTNWVFPLGMFLWYISLLFLFFSLILLTFTNKIE